jgi:putative hemolysin
LIFVVLIALSAFFSGTEIALMTLSKHAIEWYKREKRWWSKSLETIRQDSDKLLITILIGNNLVNVGASALATMSALTIAEKLNLPEGYGLALATWAVTLILLIFWEITPKTICIRYAASISLAVAPIYHILIILFTPLSFLLNLFVKWIARLFWANWLSNKMTTQEVEAFIDMSHEWGAVEEDEKKQIKNLLGLSDMTAESVMTPRVNVEFVDIDMTIDAICEMMMSASHSRFPVSGENTDDVEYIITFREAFKLQREGHWNRKAKDLSLDKIMKVPLTQPLDDLFEKFQKSRRHIALVLDEHGGTAWIVTMEDVLEEVFWDIKDETDKEDIYMRHRSDGVIDAIGTVLIDDILQEFDLHPADIWLPDEYNGEPLSYIILSEEEEFPRVDTIIRFWEEEYQLILKVTEIEDNVIGKVECSLILWK